MLVYAPFETLSAILWPLAAILDFTGVAGGDSPGL